MRIAKVILLLIIFVSLSKIIYSQEISQDEKARIINGLSSVNSTTRLGALKNIKDFSIEEAEDSLLRKIWSDSKPLQLHYLIALHAINAEETYGLTNNYLDSLTAVSTNQSLAQYWLEYKVRAINILFQLGDYSNSEFVFELLTRDKPLVNPFGVTMLKDIILNRPDLEDKAKTELVYAGESSTIDWVRYKAMTDLSELYGLGVLNNASNMLRNDPSGANRKTLFVEYFSKYQTDEINSIIKERILDEKVHSYRYIYIMELLESYGSPADYKFVQDYVTQELNLTEESLIKYELENFSLASPVETQKFVLLDTLLSYTNQCVKNEWLKDDDYKNILLNKIATAKNHLLSGDSINCRREMESFQNSITEVYSDSAKSYPKYVSDVGYKFLYYQAEYIVDRLPKIPVYVGPQISSISPEITIEKTKDFTLTVNGSNFTKKSEVYWDGKKIKTKFISENVLEAKIKGKDIEKKKGKDKKKDGVYKVHVSEKKGDRTEELEFHVYKELPEKIIPVLNCVEELDKKKLRAWFGYENYNDVIVFLDDKGKGSKPGKKLKDRPEIFLPGIHERVFSVVFEKKDKIKWEIEKEKAEVLKDSPKCD